MSNVTFFSAEESALSPIVQRNMVLFQGFCAMKYAVYALFVNACNYSNCIECVLVQQQQHHQQSEAEKDQISTSSEGAKLLFLFCSEVFFCRDTMKK